MAGVPETEIVTLTNSTIGKTWATLASSFYFSPRGTTTSFMVIYVVGISSSGSQLLPQQGMSSSLLLHSFLPAHTQHGLSRQTDFGDTLVAPGPNQSNMALHGSEGRSWQSGHCMDDHLFFEVGFLSGPLVCNTASPVQLQYSRPRRKVTL